MLWMYFDNETAALIYAASATRVLPSGENDVSEVWDVPRRLEGTGWVVASVDNRGTPWQNSWKLYAAITPEGESIVRV